MHRNNIVYKGYLLSAKVARPASHKNSAPVFAATVVISLATAAKAGISYDVPQFTSGGFSPSPSKAVDAAILFGRQVVDGMAGIDFFATAAGRHIQGG